LQQLHFDPDLANVSSSLFARKKAIVEQRDGNLKIPAREPTS
jgi:hypothetical protein